MTTLRPPISVIENDLFSPSDELVERWVASPQALGAAQRAALEASPLAQRKRRLFEEIDQASDAREPPTAGADAPASEIPPHIEAMIERRVAARERYAGAAGARPGQVRLVDRACTPSGEALGWDINRPLAVVLRAPREEAGVWDAWVAAAEIDYAGYWDVVLVEEEEQPLDPCVEMVQIWNSVRVVEASLGPVLGQLSAPRLAALESVAADLRCGERPPPEAAHPGALVDRLTVSGERVLTGTPLGASGDPRRRYQALYLAAAAMLTAMSTARVPAPALAPEAAATATDRWLDRLRARLQELAVTLGSVLEPVVPQAVMGEGDPQRSYAYRVAGVFGVRLVVSEDGGEEPVLTLSLENLSGRPLAVRGVRAGRILSEFSLAPGAIERVHVSPSAAFRMEVQREAGPVATWDLAP